MWPSSRKGLSPSSSRTSRGRRACSNCSVSVTRRCSRNTAASFATRRARTTAARSTHRGTRSSSPSGARMRRSAQPSRLNARSRSRTGLTGPTSGCAWACTQASPTVGDERYVGLGVHRAARIGAVAHGGQVLLSSPTRELVEDEVDGVAVRELGTYKLKDIDRPERLFQLDIDGLQTDFPPLSAEKVAQARPLRRRAILVGALAGVIAAAVAIPIFAFGQGGGGGSVEAAARRLAWPSSTAARADLVADAGVGASPTAVAVGPGRHLGRERRRPQRLEDRSRDQERRRDDPRRQQSERDRDRKRRRLGHQQPGWHRLPDRSSDEHRRPDDRRG